MELDKIKTEGLVEIDGALLEGGGQILRISTSLSAILRKVNESNGILAFFYSNNNHNSLFALQTSEQEEKNLVLSYSIYVVLILWERCILLI